MKNNKILIQILIMHFNLVFNSCGNPINEKNTKSEKYYTQSDLLKEFRTNPKSFIDEFSPENWTDSLLLNGNVKVNLKLYYNSSIYVEKDKLDRFFIKADNDKINIRRISNNEFELEIKEFIMPKDSLALVYEVSFFSNKNKFILDYSDHRDTTKVIRFFQRLIRF
jgi:hypothetical protein